MTSLSLQRISLQVCLTCVTHMLKDVSVPISKWLLIRKVPHSCKEWKKIMMRENSRDK